MHKKENLQHQDFCQHNILFLLYDNVTKDKIHVLKSVETFNITFERKKYIYLQTAVISHFESVSIFLYEVIVHTTDHPLVIIQNLSLKKTLKTFTILAKLSVKSVWMSDIHSYRVHVDQPSRFLTRLLHPVEAKALIHPISELTALQPLDSGQSRCIIPKNQQHEIYCN